MDRDFEGGVDYGGKGSEDRMAMTGRRAIELGIGGSARGRKLVAENGRGVSETLFLLAFQGDATVNLDGPVEVLDGIRLKATHDGKIRFGKKWRRYGRKYGRTPRPKSL